MQIMAFYTLAGSHGQQSAGAGNTLSTYAGTASLQVLLPQLPARSVLALDDTHVAAAGWDSVVYVLQQRSDGAGGSAWAIVDKAGEPIHSAAAFALLPGWY